MRYAPPGYECPFCGIAATLPTPAPESAVIFIDATVFALIPHSRYGDVRGNCIVMPRGHCENVLDMPDSLGTDIFHATRVIATAMIEAFGCEGISTRQHNGPAGNQDVWHYHLHVFPRFSRDRLWGGDKAAYTLEERIDLAQRLRTALASR